MNMDIGKSKKTSKIQNRKWKPKGWDKNAPTKEYFDAQEERFRNECFGEIKTPNGTLVQKSLF